MKRQHHLQPDDRQADLAARSLIGATAVTLAIFAVAALPEPKGMQLLGKFIMDARAHIEFEESQVWPLMRTALPAEASAELGEKIAAGKSSAPTRPHPHTPPSPGALKTAGPVAAAADKVRDAVTGRGD